MLLRQNVSDFSNGACMEGLSQKNDPGKIELGDHFFSGKTDLGDQNTYVLYFRINFLRADQYFHENVSNFDPPGTVFLPEQNLDLGMRLGQL